MKKPLSAAGVTSFIAKKEEAAKSNGKPLDLDLSLIDDDPLNRKRINPKDFDNLHEDIGANGVKEPISVRDNPDKPGRFIINSGHQRKKSCVMWGKKTIPGFIDNEFSEFDTLRVNIKKCEVDPKDILDFVQRQLDKSMRAGEIAQRLNVSPSLISQYIALTKLPPMLDEIFQSGKSTDVTLITELAKLYDKNQVEVSKFLDGHQDNLNRDNVKQLRAFINSADTNADNEEEEEETEDNPDPKGSKTKPQQHKEPDLLKVKKPLVVVTYMGEAAHLLIKKRPKQEHFWIKLCGSGEEIEVPAVHVALSELVDASES